MKKEIKKKLNKLTKEKVKSYNYKTKNNLSLRQIVNMPEITKSRTWVSNVIREVEKIWENFPKALEYDSDEMRAYVLKEEYNLSYLYIRKLLGKSLGWVGDSIKKMEKHLNT